MEKMMPEKNARILTSMAKIDGDQITVRGHDLTKDLMGKVDLAAMFFLEITGRLPDSKENALLNAMILSIVEHGMMPSAIAARLTYLGAPESFQGAVAGGLLGAGDVFVGPAGNVARLLQIEAAEIEGDISEKAENIVERYASNGKRIPGLGHPHHTIDPRAEKLMEMQRELEAPRDFTELMLAIHSRASDKLGKHLTFNAVAAIGAIASDIGIDWRAVRGIGLVARTIGLVGHVFEEIKSPSAGKIWDLVQDNSYYTDPTSK